MIANLLPISTAICERGFSSMNMIKSDERSSLGEKSPENCLRISLSDQEFDDNKLNEAYNYWKNMKNRAIFNS